MKTYLLISIIALTATTVEAKLSNRCRATEESMTNCSLASLKKAERLLAKTTKNVLASLNDVNSSDFRRAEANTLIKAITRSAALFNQMSYDVCAINSEAIGGTSFTQDVANCQKTEIEKRIQKLNLMAEDYADSADDSAENPGTAK